MGHFVMMMTCDKCSTKQSVTFTKTAYYFGTIFVRCQGCPTVHLVADNLGWYSDEKLNIEKIMERKGDSIKFITPDEETRKMFLTKIAQTRERNQEKRNTLLKTQPENSN